MQRILENFKKKREVLKKEQNSTLISLEREKRQT